MSRLEYAFLARDKSDLFWSQRRSVEVRAAIEQAIEEAAKAAGLTVFDLNPEAGWVSKAHSRDGKEWPCREETNGARPVWIWRAK